MRLPRVFHSSSVVGAMLSQVRWTKISITDPNCIGGLPMKAILVLSLTTTLALPAAAEEMMQRPESCALVATVQDSLCAVTNHFRCTGAGTVAFWNEVSYGNGVVELHALDADHGTIEIMSPDGPHIRAQNSGEGPLEAISTGNARQTSRATISHKGSSQTSTMVVEYTADGLTRELEGVTFQRLTYESDLDFPESGSRLKGSGSVLFNEELDLMIQELEVSDGQGGPDRRIKLKTLALEGQKGFGSTKPKYGCN